MQRIALRCRAEPARELDPGEVALTAAVRKLKDVPATVLAHAPPELPPERDPIVALDRGVAGDDQAAPVDAAPGRDDPPDTGPGEPKLPVDPRLRAGTVEVVEAAGDARAEDAIRDLEIAER